jgi:hypothetical protein
MCPLAVAAAHTQPSVAILKLAIGISASTTAVTRINAVLLQPLSEVTEPNRLVALESVTLNGEWVPHSHPDRHPRRVVDAATICFGWYRSHLHILGADSHLINAEIVTRQSMAVRVY